MASHTVRRVIVALSGRAEELGLLEAGIELASRLEAELAALLVEDLALLRACHLPGMRELGCLTARSHSLEPDRVARMYRAAAAEVQARLREAADARAVRYSFHVTQGHPPQQVMTFTGRMDAVLIGPRVRAGPRPQPRHPVAVFYDGTPQSEQALSLAVALAEVLGVPCTALIPARDLAEYTTKLAHARQYAGSKGLAGERLPSSETEALAEAANRLRASLLVLHAADGEAEHAWLDALLKRLACNLLLLR